MTSCKQKVGSREESEVTGVFVFSHLRMMGNFRLGKGLSAPQGLEIGGKLLWKYEETRHFGFFLWSKNSFDFDKFDWPSFRVIKLPKKTFLEQNFTLLKCIERSIQKIMLIILSTHITYYNIKSVHLYMKLKISPTVEQAGLCCSENIPYSNIMGSDYFFSGGGGKGDLQPIKKQDGHLRTHVCARTSSASALRREGDYFAAWPNPRHR